MKAFLRISSALGLLLACLSTAWAQAPTQQIGTRLDSATAFSTSASTGATITLTPQYPYVYITLIHISVCASGSAVSAAAQTSITSTNLSGLTYQIGSTAAAGTCSQEFSDNFGGTPLKASAPGPATIVLPTFAGNQTIRVNVFWYSAP
jgi:hypothetical protein